MSCRYNDVGQDAVAEQYVIENTAKEAVFQSTATQGGTSVKNFGLSPDGGIVIAGFATGSLPAAPVEGALFYDSTLKKLKFWNGSAYAAVTSV